MKTTVEEIIKHRSFSSLNASEREEVRELCSNEEDFLRMKQFLLGVETMSQYMHTEASPSLKSSLDSVFAAKYPGARVAGNGSGSGSVAAPVIPLYRRNWVRAAAVALLIVGSAPFFLWQSNSAEQESPQLAKLEEAKSTDKVSRKSEVTQANSTEQPDSETISLENTATAPAKGGSFSQEGTFSSGSPDAVAYYKVESAADEAPAAAAEAPAIAQGSSVTLSSATSGATYSWTGTTSKGFVATTQPKASAAKESFGADGVAAKDSRGNMNRGRLADLEPSNGDQAKASGATVYTRSMADQPEDLFDLLVPAF